MDNCVLWIVVGDKVVKKCSQIYELQAENERLKEKIKQAYNEGLRAYAWWKNGVQYVGSCGTTLKEALTGESDG